jgi:hypothetical protein
MRAAATETGCSPRSPGGEGSVIYQIYPLSFQDANNDGRGDLAGILSRLDCLEWLGIDVAWLGPIYPSPMPDFGSRPATNVSACSAASIIWQTRQ